MKVLYTTKCGRLTAEFEGDTQTDIWKQISSFQEVFESALTCRKNGEESSDIHFVVRTDSEDNEYFEAKVVSGPLTGTKKAYGQTKKGGFLFPRNKDKDGNWLSDGGWLKWNKEKGIEE